MMSLIMRAHVRQSLRPTARPLLHHGSNARRTLITLKETLYMNTVRGHLPRPRVGATAPFLRRQQMARHLSTSNSQSQRRSEVVAMRETTPSSSLQQVILRASWARSKLPRLSQGKKEVGAQAVVHADVSLGRPTDRPGFGLKVVLRVEGVEDQSIIDAAHEMCPYSRALREAIVVEVQKQKA
ncbi:hypothetical protein EDB87DRAFT_1210010 [Lactarius vividus]|nr:hypothetical protein EDB87DRAFT_1210010 [Lactarius vividus]